MSNVNNNLYNEWVDLAGAAQSFEIQDESDSSVSVTAQQALEQTQYIDNHQIVDISAKQSLPLTEVETAKKALAEFEKVQGKWEKAEGYRGQFEARLENATKAMDWLVNGPLYGDKSEGSSWHNIHSKIPVEHMERMKEALSIMEEVGSAVEMPFIFIFEGQDTLAMMEKIYLQDQMVGALQKEIKEIQDKNPEDPALTKLKSKLATEEEKLETLQKEISPKQFFSFMSHLSKAVMSHVCSVWGVFEKLNKAGDLNLPLTELQMKGIGLGLKGVSKSINLLLGLRKAYKVIKDDIIPLHKEIKELDKKINDETTTPKLKEELTIRKIFLKNGKTFEIAKKAFFALMDIGMGGAGLAEFIFLKVLVVATTASLLATVGTVILAVTIAVTATLYLYEQSPAIENWFAKRSLHGRVKVIEREMDETMKKSADRFYEIKTATSELLLKMGTADQMFVEESYKGLAHSLRIEVGKTITREKVLEKYKKLSKEVSNANDANQKKIIDLKVQMKTMDEIAQERVFCRKKRMDYETWRGLVIDVKDTMNNEEVKKYRLAHLQELALYSQKEKSPEYNRYHRYVHHFKVDPVKAWVAYLTNEQFEKLKFRDPAKAEFNEDSRKTFAWDAKSHVAYEKAVNEAHDEEERVGKEELVEVF